MANWACKWTEVSLSMPGASMALLSSKGTPDWWTSGYKVSSISHTQSGSPWLQCNHPLALEQKTLGQCVKRRLAHWAWWLLWLTGVARHAHMVQHVHEMHGRSRHGHACEQHVGTWWRNMGSTMGGRLWRSSRGWVVDLREEVRERQSRHGQGQKNMRIHQE